MPLSKLFSQVVNSTFTASGAIPMVRKKPRKIVTLLCTATVAATLAACAANPETPVVVSKNDGAFDANAAISASETRAPDATQPVLYTDTFTSTDESVNYAFNIQDNISVGNAPVVEVVPHFLTEEDAKRTAGVLFPEADFYEAQPSFGVVYSKDEIKERIICWSQYLSDQAIAGLFGPSSEGTMETIRHYIDDYTLRMESAPETVEKVPCRWTFQENWRYTYTEEQMKQNGETPDNELNDPEICAHTTVNGIPYKFSVSTRHQPDYIANMISVKVDYGYSPRSIDNAILEAQQGRQNPTEEQLSEAQKQAEDWLNAMELGHWMVDSCEIVEDDHETFVNYTIRVHALPAFSGAAAVRTPLLNNVRSKNEYASNYQLTEAEFNFFPDGTLYSCYILSPVDVKRVVNETPAVLTVDELMEIVKTNLSLRDRFAYIDVQTVNSLSESAGEEIVCNIDVTKIEYGLFRVKVPNTDHNYYYVPGLMVSGSVDYCGAESGTVYISSSGINPQLALNAVDGSVISLHNPE